MSNGTRAEILALGARWADAEQHGYYADTPPEWARRWPAEEIWVARKRG